jgi:phosphatase NudJ
MNIKLTVAAVINHQDKFLLVTDLIDNQYKKLNQPAGHVEYGEDCITAIKREVHEETGLIFIPTYVVGVYLYNIIYEVNYLRICFTGNVSGDNIQTPHPLPNDDVLEAKWYTKQEVGQLKTANMFRNQLVMQSINDYQDGKRYDLSVVSYYKNN